MKYHESSSGKWVKCEATFIDCPKKNSDVSSAFHIEASSPKEAEEIAARKSHPGGLFSTARTRPSKTNNAVPMPGRLDLRGHDAIGRQLPMDRAMNDLRAGKYDYVDVDTDNAEETVNSARLIGYQAEATSSNTVRLYNTAKLGSSGAFSEDDMRAVMADHAAACKQLGVNPGWKGNPGVYLNLLASKDREAVHRMDEDLRRHLAPTLKKYLNPDRVPDEKTYAANDIIQYGPDIDPPMRATFHDGPNGREQDEFGDWPTEVRRIWESSPENRDKMRVRAEGMIDSLYTGDVKKYREHMDALKKETTGIDW